MKPSQMRKFHDVQWLNDIYVNKLKVTAMAYFKVRSRYLHIWKQKITNFLDEYCEYMVLNRHWY